MKLFIVVTIDDHMKLGGQGFKPSQGGSPWVAVDELNIRASGDDIVAARDRCIVELRRAFQPEDQHEI